MPEEASSFANVSKDTWCNQFVDELVRLQPQLDTPSRSTAMAIAEAMYLQRAAMNPAHAALQYHRPLFGSVHLSDGTSQTT